MIHSKQRRGCGIQDPGTRGYSRLFAQRGHSARCPWTQGLDSSTALATGHEPHDLWIFRPRAHRPPSPISAPDRSGREGVCGRAQRCAASAPVGAGRSFQMPATDGGAAALFPDGAAIRTTLCRQGPPHSARQPAPMTRPVATNRHHRTANPLPANRGWIPPGSQLQTRRLRRRRPNAARNPPSNRSRPGGGGAGKLTQAEFWTTQHPQGPCPHWARGQGAV